MIHTKIVWTNPDTKDTQVAYFADKDKAARFVYLMFQAFGRIPVTVLTVKTRKPSTFGTRTSHKG